MTAVKPTARFVANVRDYGATGNGTTDDTAAIQAAIDASRHVVFPAGVYLVSSTITINRSTQTVEILGGATVRATTGCNGPVFQTDIGTLVRDGLFTGGGVIDCNEVASSGIHLGYFITYRISDLRIDSANSYAIKLGDTTTFGRSAECMVDNVHLYRPSSETTPTTCYGIYEENSGDHQYSNVVVQSYRYGFYACAASGSFYVNCHAWSDPLSGTMTTAFIDAGGCTFTNCYADTPLTYGFELKATNHTLIGCRVFNNSTGNDNVIEAVHFDSTTPSSQIIGCQFIGTPSHRLAKDVNLSGMAALSTHLRAVGNYNTNVVTPWLTTDRLPYIYTDGYINLAGKTHRLGTGKPSAGTFVAGDIYWNAAPAVGGNLGWVCVSAGSPGTWQGFGSVSGQIGCQVSIDALAAESAHTTWNTIAQTGNAFHGGYRSTSAQNSQVTFDFHAPAGTYTMVLFGYRTTSAATLDVTIDGASVATLDEYSASGGAYRFVTTGVAIATDGAHTIVVSNPTKNASSSGYNAYLSGIVLTRTA